ncbi:MAG: hypothetical protein J6D29_04760 [Solobacterium sp.]|nr:hypothetical protein [Solobacterium sp.]
MIAIDEESLICDLAETYHIYDYEKLPPLMVATLAVGLGVDSRIMMKISGRKLPLHIQLLGLLVDQLNYLRLEIAGNTNTPCTSIIKIMLGETEESEYESFSSGNEFEAERRRIIEGRNKNG